MLKVIALAAFIATAFAGRDDPGNNEPLPGDCKEKCAPRKCNQWANDDHPCASYEISKGIAIDPWRCGEPRCQETSCLKCGDQAKCVDMCLTHKADMVSKGYDLSSGFPDCEAVCGASADPDWKCFEDTCWPAMDAAGRPECYDYFRCSEPYCSARGRQLCYAKDNYFDPWGDRVDDACKVTQCRRCGPNSKCLDYCNDWNDRKAETDKVNCRAECASVEGWACYFTPAPQDEEDEKKEGVIVINPDVENGETADAISGKVRVHSHASKNSLLGYAFGFCTFAALAFAGCAYRRKNADLYQSI